MLNQNTERDPGIKGALFNCKDEKGMDNFGYLNSLYYFTFILYWTCKKTFWRMHAYSWTFLSPHPCQYTFSWDTSPPFKHMYFLDDPLGQPLETMLCETLCEKTVSETMFGHYVLKRKSWNSGISFRNGPAVLETLF